MPGKGLRHALSLKLSSFAKKLQNKGNKSHHGNISHVVAPYSARNAHELSVEEGQTVYIVRVLPVEHGDLVPRCLAHILDDGIRKKKEGLLPIDILSPTPAYTPDDHHGAEDPNCEHTPLRARTFSTGNLPYRKSLLEMTKETGIKRRTAVRQNSTILQSIRKRIIKSTKRHKSPIDGGSPPHRVSMESIGEKSALGLPPAHPNSQKQHLSLSLMNLPVNKDSMTTSLTESTTTNDTDDLNEPMQCVCLSDNDDDHIPNSSTLTNFELSPLEQNNNQMTDSITVEPGDTLTDEEKIEQAKEKRSFVLLELLETERGYVEDLTTIVEGYKKEMDEMEDLPQDLKEKEKMVFGNIEQILDFHKTVFLPEIEKCYEDVQALGSLFKRQERRLLMYVKYCENKPKSEYIIAEFSDTIFQDLRVKLNQRLQIQDLMIKPVQRIMKYQLLLKDIRKYTERCQECTETLQQALDVMHIVPKAANDMMEVGRLQGYEGSIVAQGRVLIQATVPTFILHNIKPESSGKFKDRRVFVFEQLIIFSDLANHPLTGPYYKFKCAFKFNNMTVTQDVSEGPLMFTITVSFHNKENRSIYFNMPDPLTKQQWCDTLQQQIDLQGDFMRALVSPIAFQNGTLERPSSTNTTKHAHYVERSQSLAAKKPSTRKSPKLFEKLNRKKFATTDAL